MKKALFQKAILIALVVALLCTAVYAADAAFPDVPKNHWANEAVEAIAAGGLVKGYENGEFRPKNAITVAELAVIVARANGFEGETHAYWAYSAIDYCINTLECLPDMGEIIPANYKGACSRELAVYMLVKGVGSNKPEAAKPDFTADQIPDYDQCDDAYKAAVLEAYRLGLVQGMDYKHTFAPKSTFTRADMATIFFNAKVLSPKEPEEPTVPDEPDTPVVPDEPEESALTNAEIFDLVKNNPYWKERIYNKVGRYGGWILNPLLGEGKLAINASTEYTSLRVLYTDNYSPEHTGVISISLGEKIRSSALEGYDINGEPLSDELIANNGFAEDGTYMLISGYNYKARQLCRDVLIGFLGEEGGMEAYAAMKEVFLGQSYAATTLSPNGGSGNPSAVKWINNRCVVMELEQPGAEDAGIIQPCFGITIYELGDREIYDALLAADPGTPVVYEGVFGADKFFDAYELDKW